MLNALAVPGAALLAMLCAGIAAGAVLDRRGRWLHLTTVPLGAVTLLGLLYPLGWLMPMSTAGPVVVGLVVIVAAVAVGARAASGAGAGTELRAALVPPRDELAALATGLAATLALLWPVIATGRATTIAITNNDGWYYAGLIDWLRDHAAGAAASIPLPDAPMLQPVVNMKANALPVGFEFLATAMAEVTGRASFEVAGPLSALAGLLAATGWAHLARAVLGPGRWWVPAAAAFGAVTPLLTLASAENYITQTMGLALMPYAAGAAVAFARDARWARLVPAALAAGAVLAVYPSLLPWLALTAAAALAARGTSGLRWVPATREGLRPRALRWAALGGSLAAAVVALAPLQLWRTLEFARAAADLAGAGPFPVFGPRANGGFLMGAGTSQADAVPWSATAWALVVAALLVIVLAGAVRGSVSRVPAAIAVAALAATAVVAYRYEQSDFAYGIFKSLLSGGAILAGPLLVGLLALRRPWIGLAGVAACLVVWVPQSTQALRDQERSIPGFRAPEFALRDRLAAVPDAELTLVDGAAADWDYPLFRLRMMAAYFGTATDLRMEGLGSTYSYIAPGGEPQWRPDRAWTHVLSTGRATPFGAGRRGEWATGGYLLQRAPTLDVAPYSGWWNAERDASGVFQWTGAAADMVISNRGAATRVELRLRVSSYARPRRVVLTAADGTVTAATVPARGATEIGIPVDVPSGGVAPVLLQTDPAAENPPGDGRAIALRVSRVTVTPMGGAPGDRR